MPHIHIEEFKSLEYPQSIEDVTFNFQADNMKHDDELLISTTIDEKEFFLLLKNDKNKTLLKSDKISRVSPNYYTKHALKLYAEAADLKVKASNIENDKKPMHFEGEEYLKSITHFAESFPKVDDLRIEVGFGSGRHLIHQAQNNPDILFVGIEIHKPSIEQTLKQITLLGLKNLLLLDYDARLFMEMVPSNIVSRIYVHFPVPWDKKPHRRVISKSFVAESLRVLQKGGRLELRTDSENYYEYSFATYTSLNQLSMELKKNHDIAISSKYEDRWKKMEKNIYDLTLICEEESEGIDRKFDFSFKDKAYDLEKIEALNSKVFKFESSFIHFERGYKTSRDELLMRLSIGSYDRPEHLYILVNKNGVKYYPNAPLASRTTYTTHLELQKILEGEDV